MPGADREVRAVLFDLWNTLVYSDFSPNPMTQIAGALGIAGDPVWRKRIERGMMTRRFLGIREALAGLERETGSKIGSALEREALIRTWNEACAATRFHDDAFPALRALARRHRLGVVSNTQSFDLEFLRDPEFASLVGVTCLSCDQGRLKPDPAIFHAAARAIGAPPDRILMVGDNPEDDVRGAMGAGMIAVHLDRSGTAGAVRSAASAATGSAGTIASLTELSGWLG